MKKVTILILTWNNLELLSNCIKCVKSQSYKNFDLLVVANGSKTETLKYLRKKNIRFIRYKINRGTVIPFNFAAKQIRTEYLAFLNDDTEPKKDWLFNLYKTISSNPKISSVDSQILYKSNKKRIWSAGANYSVFGKTWFRYQGKKIFKKKKPQKIFASVGTAVIYRKKTLEKIGFINKNIYLSHEDIDLGMKINLVGHLNYINYKAQVYHHVSATTKIGSESYIFNSHRSVEIIFLCNLPLTILIFLIFPHLIFILGGIPKYLVEKKLKVYLKSKFSVLKDLNKLLKERKKVKSLTSASLIQTVKNFF